MYKCVNFSSLVKNLVSQCTGLGANTIWGIFLTTQYSVQALLIYDLHRDL